MNSASGHSGSLRVLGVGEVEDRVLAADTLDRLQDRIPGHGKPVVVHPLDVADPDDRLGQLLGEGVDLQPGKLRRPDVREQRQARAPPRRR